MRRLSSKLTYANVMSTLAVFLLIGGGAAYAAGQLGKNSVGSKQLKKNAVVTAKVKNEAITGAKVKRGTLTGNQIDASTLGVVPSANVAGSAPPTGPAGGALEGSFPNPQLKRPEEWHQIATFETCSVNPSTMSWKAYGGAQAIPAYYRDPFGVVHLKGSVKCPESPSGDYPIFRLPAGFRPAGGEQYFSVVNYNNEPTTIALNESGLVTNLKGNEATAQQLTLDGVTFRAES